MNNIDKHLILKKLRNGRRKDNTLEERMTIGDYSCIKKNLYDEDTYKQILDFDHNEYISVTDMYDMEYMDSYEDSIQFTNIYSDIEVLVDRMPQDEDLFYLGPDPTLIVYHQEFRPNRRSRYRDLCAMTDEEYVGLVYEKDGIGDSSLGLGPEDYSLDDLDLESTNGSSNFVNHNLVKEEDAFNGASPVNNQQVDKFAADISISAIVDGSTLSQKNSSSFNLHDSDKRSLIMSNAIKDNNSEKSSKGKQRYCIEESIFGRGFSPEESVEFTFMEFLTFLFGITPDECDGSRLDYVARKLASATINNTNITSKLNPAHLLRRMLYDNANLNSRFIEDHSDGDLWTLWRDYYISVHEYDNDEAFIERFTKYVDHLQECFTESNDDNANESFKRFFNIVDILRSNTFDYTSSKRWTSKILFPFSKRCLFHDAEVNLAKGKPKTQEKLNLDSRFFRGQGHTLLAMLSLSSSTEVKNEIESKLSDLLNQEDDIFTKAVKVLAGDEIEGLDEPVMNEDIQTKKGMSYFPIQAKESCQSLFDNMAEDFVSILNLKFSARKKIRVLTIISSLYIYCYLLRRSYIVIQQYDSKFPEPYMPLIFGNCDLRTLSKSVHGYYENIIARTVRDWLLLSIKRELSERSYDALTKYVDEPSLEFDNSKDVTEQFKNVISSVLYIDKTKDDEVDLNKIVYKCSSFEKILSNCTAALRKRRDFSSIVSDAMLAKTAKSIGLVTKGTTNYYHYAITDELLEALVLTCCNTRYMQNSDFLEKIFNRFRMVVSANDFSTLKSTDTHFSVVDENKVKHNETLLQSRLKQLGLCKELSDASFYYIFNPYIDE